MRHLLLFLSKHSSLFVLLFYVVVCLGLMFRFNTYQQSIYFSSCNYLVGMAYDASSVVRTYLGAPRNSEEVSRRNAELEDKILRLEERLKAVEVTTLDSLDNEAFAFQYAFKTAKVINNSVSRLDNYLTLNKGTLDGIQEETGVVNEQGVVGIVERVSDHFAIVLPILNSKSKISCKVLGSTHFGSLMWDGEDPQVAILEALPRHVEFLNGDTIVTSGYSTIFPEGLPVGTILEHKKSHNDNFYSLKVKLFADFSGLRHVRVISNKLQTEQQELEKKIGIHD